VLEVLQGLFDGRGRYAAVTRACARLLVPAIVLGEGARSAWGPGD
jgi:hypothetical protein